jgi:hypothetical protein
MLTMHQLLLPDQITLPKVELLLPPPLVGGASSVLTNDTDAETTPCRQYWFLEL